MSRATGPVVRVTRELRRRRVFQTAGVYIVGAWLVMQVADVLFPAWGLPDAALNVLLFAALLCFPLALVFGWFYDITSRGIVRTRRAGPGETDTALGLKQSDYIILSALALIAAVVVVDAVRGIATITPASDVSDAEPDGFRIEAPENSIAVLPFTNISADPSNEAFCDGISEEILHKLGEFGDLHVIARTSSFAFKNSDYRIPRIAAILGVRYLLQGSVRRSGNKLRISAQLVDRSGAQRWSDRFDRELQDIFDLQTEIADIVATTVVPKIDPRHDAVYEPNVAAYQRFLVGRDLLHGRQVEAARAELARAIELDPAFAEAQAEYAIAMGMWNPDREMLEDARRAIEEALRLRPGLPRALAARGLLLSDTDPVRAEALLREVIAADPTMADAINWLASSLTLLGKHDEALEWRQRGIRIDPLHPANTSNLAGGYLVRGAVDEAERILLRYNQQPNPSLMVVIDTARFYRRIGRLPEALEYLRRAANLPDAVNSYPAFSHFQLAGMWAMLGDFRAAEEWAARGRATEPAVGSLEWTMWVRMHVEPAAWIGDYAGAIDRFDAISGARDAARLSCDYGYLLAMVGEYMNAIDWLSGSEGEVAGCAKSQHDADLALAWAYIQLGQSGPAESILFEMNQAFGEKEQAGRLHRSDDLYHYALTSLLLDEPDAALERLQRAIDAGWREYYLHRHDPRWSALWDDPRYVSMMQWVKADIDRQASSVQPEL